MVLQEALLGLLIGLIIGLPILFFGKRSLRRQREELFGRRIFLSDVEVTPHLECRICGAEFSKKELNETKDDGLS